MSIQSMQKLRELISTKIMSGRLFIYEYNHQGNLTKESQRLYNEFAQACQQLSAPKMRIRNDFYLSIAALTLKLDELPRQWPNRALTWKVAVAACPTHSFAEAFNSENPPNYLLYGCDPEEFDAAETSYKWTELYGHAPSPFKQLAMMAGIDMNAEALEYRELIKRLKIIPLLMWQIDARRRTVRRLPNTSIVKWTDYAPPVDWQLTQALVRIYLETYVGRFWYAMIHYTGVDYKYINNELRKNPLILDPLSNAQFQNGVSAFWSLAWKIQWLMAFSPPLPKPCIVYRYHNGTVLDVFAPILHLNSNSIQQQFDNDFSRDQYVIRKLNEKKYIALNGFTSTTINLSYVLSKMISNETIHLLEVHLPPGTHCCSWPSQEYELILPHRSVVKFVDSYMIGTDFLETNPQLSPALQEIIDSASFNTAEIRVLVFQLVYDGIAFAEDVLNKLPQSIQESQMPMPEIVKQSRQQDWRKNIGVKRQYVSAERVKPKSFDDRQHLYQSIYRAHSAQSRLMRSGSNTNRKKRGRASSPMDRNQ